MAFPVISAIFTIKQLEKIGHAPGTVLDDQVIMVIHQAISQNANLQPFACHTQEVQENRFVFIAGKYPFAAMAAVHAMVECSGKSQPCSSHFFILTF